MCGASEAPASSWVHRGSPACCTRQSRKCSSNYFVYWVYAFICWIDKSTRLFQWHLSFGYVLIARMCLWLLILICVWFVVDLPSLAGTRYIWHRDEVQTSRLLFYLRVVPTCIGLIPAHMFRDKVASIMFLYPLCILLYCFVFLFVIFYIIFSRFSALIIVLLSTNKIPSTFKWESYKCFTFCDGIFPVIWQWRWSGWPNSFERAT